MKRVTLKQLTLNNFRGQKNLTVDFNETQTTVSGANATGKSTIFDAFMWLLFGKDAQDRKDFNVKRLVNGKSIDKVDAEVIGILDVDGETVTLRRAFVERWAKPSGQAEEVFKGNETETSYNDVPMNVTEYQRRVSDIIDDAVFKMVTNPLFFANMKWETQREHLFQLAGTISDAEIANSNPDYASLLDQISGKSFADFKREIAAKKKKAKEQLEAIQPRIDQTVKLMPEAENFEGIEKEIADLNASLAETEKAIESKAEAANQRFAANQAKINQINQLKQQQNQAVFDAKSKQTQDAFTANEKRRELINGVSVAKHEIDTAKRAIENDKLEIETSRKQLAQKDTAIAELRQKWYDENAKEYDGDETCHTCGQPLPEAMKIDALNIFTAAKIKKLTEITQNGSRLGDERKAVEQDIENAEKSLKTHENALKAKQGKLTELEASLAETPEVAFEEIEAETLPVFKTLQAEINKLQAEVYAKKTDEPADTSELKTQKTAIDDEISSLKKRLYNKVIIQNYTEEIENLNKQGKQLAQQIADIESVEFTMKAFTKAKIEESEKRINGLFSFVSFRLYDYTQEGNEFETCIPLVDGVPFPVANSAGKLNAGIDIINALTKFHGVSAPIVIDNREGINEIIPTESQIINLVVTRDKELIIS